MSSEVYVTKWNFQKTRQTEKKSANCHLESICYQDVQDNFESYTLLVADNVWSEIKVLPVHRHNFRLHSPQRGTLVFALTLCRHPRSLSLFQYIFWPHHRDAKDSTQDVYEMLFMGAICVAHEICAPVAKRHNRLLWCPWNFVYGVNHLPSHIMRCESLTIVPSLRPQLQLWEVSNGVAPWSPLDFPLNMSTTLQMKAFCVPFSRAPHHTQTLTYNYLLLVPRSPHLCAYFLLWPC